MEIGIFVVNGEKYDSTKFTKLILKWSFDGQAFATKKLEKCIPEWLLLQRIGSTKHRYNMVLSYCIALNLLGASVTYDLPVDSLRQLGDSVHSDLKLFKSNLGLPFFDESESKLLAHLIPKYFASLENFVLYENPKSLTIGPGNELLSDILSFYEVSDHLVKSDDKVELVEHLHSMIHVALRDFRNLKPLFIRKV